MMKYTYKFEEMIDSRNEAIFNLEKVKTEQLRLIEVLKNHDEKETDEKLKFTPIIEDLVNKTNQMSDTIEKYKKQNASTISLVLKLKKTDKESCKLVEEVLDEIGIFKEPEMPQQEVVQENKEENKEEK